MILRMALVRNIFLYVLNYFSEILFIESYLKTKLWSLNWKRYNKGIHYIETSKMVREISNAYPQLFTVYLNKSI